LDFSLPTKIENSDIIGLAVLFVFVLLTLFIAEILRRKDKVSGSTSRKIVHLSVGNVVLLFPYVFSNIWFALIGPIFFIPFTYFTCPGSPIKKFRLKGVGEGHTYGTVFYAISLTVLVILFFSPDQNNPSNIILFGAFMPLVWGDGISAVVGSKFGNDKAYKIFGGTKTLLGSWAAAFATFGAVTISCIILSQPAALSVYLGLITGFVTAFIEAMTPKGFDNIAVPAANAIVLYLLSLNSFAFASALSNNAIITGAAVGLFLAVSGILLKALTWDGAIAGLYFGLVILGLGSWVWGIMYVAFFVLGSLTTFLGKKKKESISQEFEKGDTRRDSVQAMVNSVIPAILAFLIILFREPIITVIAGGAIAVSLADTLGTEIGALSRFKPRSSIKPWIKVDQGSPGAVSILGLVASLFGAVIIAFIGFGFSFVDNYAVFPSIMWAFIIPVIVGGFIGSYFDSIFACTIQKLNKCNVCGKITEKKEHCNESTEHHSGVKWLRNDVVNLFSIIVGAAVSLLLYFIWMF
jgi:uncharacterized protein (TIGR00297 family)